MTRDGVDDVAILVESRRDPAVFGELFERHFGDVYRYLARRVGHELAEELAAVTFSEAFRSRASFDAGRGAPRGWLFGIANNVVRQHARAEARRLEAQARLVASSVNETDGSIERLIDRLGVRCVLDAALSTLDRDVRDVLLLVGAAELTYGEAAAAMGIPIGTVRSRLWRARRELRQALATLTGGSSSGAIRAQRGSTA